MTAKGMPNDEHIDVDQTVNKRSKPKQQYVVCGVANVMINRQSLIIKRKHVDHFETD